MDSEPAQSPQKLARKRLPLSGSNPRRLSFELRLRIWLAALSVPLLLLVGTSAVQETHSLLETTIAVLVAALVWAMLVSSLFESIMRPLQTLSNVVAALREDDFSFRARGARRGDSMGDLAHEINALAGTLQRQRTSARDALTLAELVMHSMQAPVLAFDSAGRLRLINAAAEQTLQLRRREAVGRTASELQLQALIQISDHGVYESAVDELSSRSASRWSVRRTTFRLHGVPHTLLVLTDITIALREEERLAWRRLIRVLGHEINNSLTPIKSIAGSLRARLPDSGPEQADFDRGLSVIEDRAESLNRFLQAYQELWRLPPPARQPVDLARIVHQVAGLELRLAIEVHPGDQSIIYADPDQIEQLLINLTRNAVEAALEASRSTDRSPRVDVGWYAKGEDTVIEILDNGLGIANPGNLFVPFYTTKAGGSGIGLLLAQQIALAHEGSVTLANRTGSPGCRAEVIVGRPRSELTSGLQT